MDFESQSYICHAKIIVTSPAQSLQWVFYDGLIIAIIICLIILYAYGFYHHLRNLMGRTFPSIFIGKITPMKLIQKPVDHIITRVLFISQSSHTCLILVTDIAVV